MTRRDFLRNSALASSLLLVPKFLHALDRGPGLARLGEAPGARRLIVVQLSGGNDGLNTIIPYKNDLYYRARPTLGIREAQGILAMEKDLGLHPALKGLKGLYDQGHLAVLNSVGYPNPDRSHFRSMDIWQSGLSSDQAVSTGWLGRYLDSNCADCRHPYNALEIDDTLSLALKGNARKGLALKNPAKLHQLTQNRLLAKVSQQAAPAHHDQVDYLYKTLAETASSADYLFEKSKIYKSAVAYPNSEFGKNLKTTAELITSGVESRVYYLALSGFDTHVRQLEQQQRLLGDLGDGLAALAHDLQQHNQWNNTLVLVFSEFGRRVGQNASNGTDHGTANNVLLLGGGLRKKGVLNAAPDLANLDQGDLRHQIDFRSIYASILKDWLGADDTAILGTGFERMSGLV
ncbi:twin-arginine translocation pathway signal [Hymenobacter glacialis]|uniref:Twin-arginine translocation pathway signal n=1 Tax=Hymenobacter glacialis TaxID=1908236 RepID=A0A1G1SYG5_9BACT|nr:twin-arginine translocation pathway signal [Hymenobacter glacialis]